MSTNGQSAGISTWDASPPARPGLADYDGAALKDRTPPPNPGTMPRAALFNTISLTEIAMGQVIQNATVSVRFAGGAPFIDSHGDMPGVSPGATAPQYTVERTPGGAGAGDIFLYWPANTFPPPKTRPKVCLNGATPGMAPAVDWYTDAGSGNSGVRIVTLDHTGAAADLPFTVDIM